MKSISIIILILLSFTAFSQPIKYADWQAEAKKDNRLLPEYGGAPRTKAQKAEDETYIKTATEEMHADRHDGSNQLVDLGFKYIEKGDLRAAMYRFNQAWILDPKNANIYSGFGTIYFIFQDLKRSIQYFDKGLAMDGKNSNLLTYKARSLMAMFETKKDTAAFFSSFPLLKKSYSIEPKNPYTTYMLSRYYIRMSQCDSAVKYYNKCKKSGGQPITPEYEKAVKTICKAMDK